jgi:hypothetical protein
MLCDYLEEEFIVSVPVNRFFRGSVMLVAQ